MLESNSVDRLAGVSGIPWFICWLSIFLLTGVVRVRFLWWFWVLSRPFWTDSAVLRSSISRSSQARQRNDENYFGEDNRRVFVTSCRPRIQRSKVNVANPPKTNPKHYNVKGVEVLMVPTYSYMPIQTAYISTAIQARPVSCVEIIVPTKAFYVVANWKIRLPQYIDEYVCFYMLST